MIRPPCIAAIALLGLLVSGAFQTARADEPRYIRPDDGTGASAAVVVGNGSLVHTTQILPSAEGPRASGAAEQAGAVLDRLDSVLRAAQSELRQVVKLNLYVAKQEDVEDVQRVLARRFSGPHKPAVSWVVTPLSDARVLVAADAVATTSLDPGVVLLGGEGEQAPPAPPSAQFAVVPGGSRIYVAGQAERSESLAEATRKTLESLRATLRFLERRDEDIVQLKAFLMPMTEAEVVEREVAAFFPGRPAPPLVLVEWKSGAQTPIEIELIAWGGQKPAVNAISYATPPGMTASPVFSRVATIHHSPTIYVSGLYASPGGDADPQSPAAGQREVKEIFTSLEEILHQAGSDFDHLAKATYYVATDAASAKLNELRPRYYDPQRPPAASKAAVAAVGRPGLGLTIDMIATPRR
jgi:enamine deaminase RidA (YjgF/YER057c/UK114 family)